MSTVAVTNLKHESATGNNIILDSSGNAAFADGSASTPSITNDGDLNTGIFFPAADNIGFATNGVIRGRWTNDGLCFNADTAAANALDDYEEGTWTPNIQNSGSSSTFTQKSGRYTKIGRLVYCSFVCDNGNSGTAGGNLTLLDLPFTYGGTSNVPTLVSFTANGLATSASVSSRTQGGSTSFILTTIQNINLTAQVSYAAGTVIYEV